MSGELIAIGIMSAEETHASLFSLDTFLYHSTSPTGKSSLWQHPTQTFAAAAAEGSGWENTSPIPRWKA